MANNTVLLRKADEYNKQRMELITQDYKYDKRIVKIRSSSRYTDSAYFCKNQKSGLSRQLERPLFFIIILSPQLFRSRTHCHARRGVWAYTFRYARSDNRCRAP